MLNIKDLAASKALDSNAMTTVRGGFNPFAMIDGSTTLTNRVADVSQLFGFALDQTNAGKVTNNQIIEGGNGIVYAPVNQNLDQGNLLSVSDIGNTRVS